MTLQTWVNEATETELEAIRDLANRLGMNWSVLCTGTELPTYT